MSKNNPPFALAITGAPASGKNTCFEGLKVLPGFTDFIFFDEVARNLLQENPNYRNNWSAFHREIYRRQVQQESRAIGLSFVTDRGTVDAFAFHPETAADVGTTIEAEYRRYSAVIHLGSSASLGEKYYARDTERTELLADVLAIENATADVWQDHPGYYFLPAEINFDLKLKRFLSLAGRLIAK